MRVTGYICCALVLTCFLKGSSSEQIQNKFQQQFLDAFTPDETAKMKRPFCNAFTGCGRKRSFYDSATGSQDTETSDSIRLPLSVYKALLRVASQNIRATSDRDINDYQLPETPQVYFSRKLPLRKRLDIPSTSSD